MIPLKTNNFNHMKTKRYFSKKRIIIYYLLVIVIPSCILGFLALRGIRNDQALTEREQRKKLSEYGASVFSESISHIAIVNKEFRKIIPDFQRTNIRFVY